MAKYFHKYEYGNTEMKDLMDILEEEFSKQNLGFSLADW